MCSMKYHHWSLKEERRYQLYALVTLALVGSVRFTLLLFYCLEMRHIFHCIVGWVVSGIFLGAVAKKLSCHCREPNQVSQSVASTISSTLSPLQKYIIRHLKIQEIKDILVSKLGSWSEKHKKLTTIDITTLSSFSVEVGLSENLTAQHYSLNGGVILYRNSHIIMRRRQNTGDWEQGVGQHTLFWNRECNSMEKTA